MKKKHLLPIVICVAAIAVLTTAFSRFQISQADIDKSTMPVKLSVTGKPYGDASISHDGRQVSADSSVRDVYTNMKSKKEAIKPGTIFTKRVYMAKPDGSKGDLAMLFAMVKREKGYYPEGGDWEYASMPADKSTDYKMHPNGMLPANADDKMRGKITACKDCHFKAGGDDFVFTNDDMKPKCGPKTKCNPCNPKSKCNPCKPKSKCNPK